MSAEPRGPLVDATAAPDWLRPLVRRSAELHPGHLGWPREQAPPDARPASVLILFADGPDGPDVLLLRRADGLNSHPGQVAFPGGSVDPDDRGPVDAALREATEEVGVRPEDVRPVAALPELHLAFSHFRVTPVVAHWWRPGPVTPVDPGETAAVSRVPISWLVDPANRLSVELSNRVPGPAFVVPGMLVWGFTGALLSGVLDLGGWARSWNRSDVRHLDVAWAAAEQADEPGFGRH